MRLWSASGQAMSEYVVVLFSAVLVLLVILGPFRTVIENYLKGIYFFVGSPIP
jgi:hypothetical protein